MIRYGTACRTDIKYVKTHEQHFCGLLFDNLYHRFLALVFPLICKSQVTSSSERCGPLYSHLEAMICTKEIKFEKENVYEDIVGLSYSPQSNDISITSNQLPAISYQPPVTSYQHFRPAEMCASERFGFMIC